MKASPLVIVGGLAFAVYAVLGERAVCPTAGLFGFPCPSCGLVRASLMLLRGNWRGANAMHPLVMPVLIYLVVAVAVAARWQQWGGSRSLRISLTTLGVALVTAMTLLWLARWCGYLGGPVVVHPWRW